jgi:hypothetical protein
MAEWDFPPAPRFMPRRPPMIEGYAARGGRRPPPASWTSPAAKESASKSLGAAIWTAKIGLAIFLGLIIAAGLWFLELLATT